MLLKTCLVFLPLWSLGEGLWCFQCSEFGRDREKQCPLSTTNHTTWSRNSNKYYEILGASRSCVIGYSTSTDQVHYQSSITKAECESKRFQERIILNLHSAQSGGSDGQVACCFADGCNWNGTVAKSGASYEAFVRSRFTTRNSGPIQATGSIMELWMYILIGVIALLLLLACCCCCFFCCCRKKRKETDEDNQNDEYLGYYYRDRQFGDSAKDSGQARRINVASAELPPDVQLFTNRDHERYSAIDRKIYQRTIPTGSTESDFNSRESTPKSDSAYYDNYNKNRIGAISRDVFDNDSFRQANAVVNPGDKPETKKKHQEWQEVWNKPMKNDPEKFPNANPFKFSDEP